MWWTLLPSIRSVNDYSFDDFFLFDFMEGKGGGVFDELMNSFLFHCGDSHCLAVTDGFSFFFRRLDIVVRMFLTWEGL